MAEPLTIVSVGAGALALVGIAWATRRRRGGRAGGVERDDAPGLAATAGDVDATDRPAASEPWPRLPRGDDRDDDRRSADTWVMTPEELDVIARVATRADGGHAFASTARELARSLARAGQRDRAAGT